MKEAMQAVGLKLFKSDMEMAQGLTKKHYFDLLDIDPRCENPAVKEQMDRCIKTVITLGKAISEAQTIIHYNAYVARLVRDSDDKQLIAVEKMFGKDLTNAWNKNHPNEPITLKRIS